MNSCQGKLFICGATGHTGSATVSYLYQNFPNICIVAGVRDVKKAKDEFPNIQRNLEFALVDNNLTGNLRAVNDLARSMQGCDAVLVVPPVEGRVEISKAYVDAAKMAGVKFICLISAAVIGKRDTILFARQFMEIENHIKMTGICHAFLRCPSFLENLLGDAQSVKKDKTFCHPVNPDARFDPVAVSDVGAMAATVMVNSLKKPGMTSASTTTTTGKGMGMGMQQQPQSSTMAQKMTTMQTMPESKTEMIYYLTGPKCVSMTDIAGMYSKARTTPGLFVCLLELVLTKSTTTPPPPL